MSYQFGIYERVTPAVRDEVGVFYLGICKQCTVK